MSITPEWTAGYVFHVAYRIGDDGPGWIVRVADGRPVAVTDGADPTATATVQAPSPAGMLALLTRTEPPAEGPITVAGDAAAAASLARWFDRAQGFRVLGAACLAAGGRGRARRTLLLAARGAPLMFVRNVRGETRRVIRCSS